MDNVEKTTSGYRIRWSFKGKRYVATFDHYPSEREIKLAKNKKMINDEPVVRNNLKFSDAWDDFKKSKRKVFSPSTMGGYESIYKNLPIDIKERRISKFDSFNMQKYINDLVEKGNSQKTIKNKYAFIMSVVNEYREDEKPIKVKLPEKKKKETHIPTQEEANKLFEYFRGTEYEIPILLGAMSLRLSEVCALTIDDLDENNVLSVSKAKVKSETGKFVTKSTKTVSSTRDVLLPDYVADLIREKGYVYKGNPNVIYHNMIRAEEKLGLPHFTFHSLRHFFCSYCHNILKLSDKQIQVMGGWSENSTVMKRIYQHEMEVKESQEKLVSAYNNVFNL